MQHQHHPFDVGGVSLLEDGDGLSIDDKLPALNLDCAFELATSRIILEHVDHVVEVNERITDDDNIHFARLKSSPGDQVTNMGKSFHSDLHHSVSGLQLALHKKTPLSVKLEEQRASHSYYITTFLSIVETILQVPGSFHRKI